MKFTRFGRYEPVNMTPRRQSALVRKQQKELARYPLLPDVQDEIAAAHLSVEAERERRQQHRDSFEVSQRAFHARVWKDARRLYFSLPDHLRAAVRSAWEKWTGPRTALYFNYQVDTISGEQARRVARIAAEQGPLIEAAKARIQPAYTLPLFS